MRAAWEVRGGKHTNIDQHPSQSAVQYWTSSLDHTLLVYTLPGSPLIVRYTMILIFLLNLSELVTIYDHVSWSSEIKRNNNHLRPSQLKWNQILTIYDQWPRLLIQSNKYEIPTTYDLSWSNRFENIWCKITARTHENINLAL